VTGPLAADLLHRRPHHLGPRALLPLPCRRSSTRPSRRPPLENLKQLVLARPSRRPTTSARRSCGPHALADAGGRCGRTTCGRRAPRELAERRGSVYRHALRNAPPARGDLSSAGGVGRLLGRRGWSWRSSSPCPGNGNWPSCRRSPTATIRPRAGDHPDPRPRVPRREPPRRSALRLARSEDPPRMRRRLGQGSRVQQPLGAAGAVLVMGHGRSPAILRAAARARYGPQGRRPFTQYTPPGPGHPMGTDQPRGRDRAEPRGCGGRGCRCTSVSCRSCSASPWAASGGVVSAYFGGMTDTLQPARGWTRSMAPAARSCSRPSR